MLSGACGLRTCYLPYSPLLRRAASFSSPFTRRRRFFSTACVKKEKVIVISGPTGAGKSRLALELAKRLNGEIISADSVQVYRGLDVGSAKPSTSERKATRSILDNGRVPIVVGGTGLYLRWFIYGKPDVPKASPEISSEVYSELADLQRNEDWDAAVQLVVKAGDPKAQLVAVNDWYRLRRSLEIIKSSGSPPSAFQVPYHSFREQGGSVTDSSDDVNYSADSLEENKSKDLDYDFNCFFLSSQRVDLYRLIDYRCEDMLSGSDGILSEARWLLDTGLLPNSNSATRAIGYRQVYL
uniref:tRNA dimethylallyltransferase 9 n=1 Tax=Fagus sylvatica TaxID=28930 RepID=A0A2N9EYH4_FAGSY